jgi:signal peptidase I
MTGRRLATAGYRWGKRAVVAAIVSAALSYLALIVLRYEPMVMVTGSMQRTIPVGSLVVDRNVDPQELEVGDVISFQKPLGAKGIDTHRIVAIKNDKGKRLYQTKGDSNPVADPWVISFDPGMTAHRVAFSVPYAGNALIFARSPLGRLALIAYVCLILLLSVFRAIAATAKDKTQPPTGKTTQAVTKRGQATAASASSSSAPAIIVEATSSKAAFHAASYSGRQLSWAVDAIDAISVAPTRG